MRMHNFVINISALLLLGALQCEAHTRFLCPPPRGPNTGAKTGPCDTDDDPTQPAFELTPGLNTITWEESISHPGAPGRFALSLDGDDSGESFESCLLLDHVPHDDHADLLVNPIMKEAPSPTYHQFKLTIFIPDVKCERCHLQFVTYMTDDVHGVPKNTSCVNKFAKAAGKLVRTASETGADEGKEMKACPVVYHSCAPVKINGKTPRNDYTCDLKTFEQELGWPWVTGAATGGAYPLPPPSEYYWKGDAGIYDQKTHFLQAGGTPIQDCKSFKYCDPTSGEYSDYTLPAFVVPADAKYIQPTGACLAYEGHTRWIETTTTTTTITTTTTTTTPGAVASDANPPAGGSAGGADDVSSAMQLCGPVAAVLAGLAAFAEL